ncbi:MAG: hypothetical protein CMO81_00510 [Waddliaceae bacterium]|nr:hypothetical protein [Waddliaceae bacterium]
MDNYRRLDLNNLNKNSVFVASGDKKQKGFNGYVREGGDFLFNGRSITVNIGGREICLNRGSLIDFINNNKYKFNIEDSENLSKGFLFFGGVKDEDLKMYFNSYVKKKLNEEVKEVEEVEEVENPLQDWKYKRLFNSELRIDISLSLRKKINSPNKYRNSQYGDGILEPYHQITISENGGAIYLGDDQVREQLGL